MCGHATSTSIVPHPWLSFVLEAASNFRCVHLRRDQTMLQVSAMVKRARWLERKYVGRLRLESSHRRRRRALIVELMLSIGDRMQLRIAQVDALHPYPSRPPLVDTFNRKHDYLRISLTEKCNLRCKLIETLSPSAAATHGVRFRITADVSPCSVRLGKVSIVCPVMV